MALKAGDHFGAGVLIGPHHGAKIFRVELAGQHRRTVQDTTQHGELATFGFRWVIVVWWRFGSRVRFLDDRLWWSLDSWSRWLRFRAAIAGPYQDAIIFINGQLLRVDEFVL